MKLARFRKFRKITNNFRIVFLTVNVDSYCPDCVWYNANISIGDKSLYKHSSTKTMKQVPFMT